MEEEAWVTDAEGIGPHHRMLKSMEIEERRDEEEKPPQSIAEAIEGVPSGQNEEEVEESATVQQQQKKEEPPPPMISLNIPTAEKHISEETLNDALLLQESEEGVNTMASVDQQQQQPSEAEDGTEGDEATNDAQTADEGAKTNAEAAVAAKDAAESAEAIRTATAAVKNIMNDPKSVEARTCCASILSVFHDHCDPTTTGVED
jgi:hypothetical protein